MFTQTSESCLALTALGSTDPAAETFPAPVDAIGDISANDQKDHNS